MSKLIRINLMNKINESEINMVEPLPILNVFNGNKVNSRFTFPIFPINIESFLTFVNISHLLPHVLFISCQFDLSYHFNSSNQ